MAQNITIAGASYSDVPRIDVPKTGGGVASFEDASGAKTDLAAWLTDNGVTVPSGATLDTLVGLLDSVEVGGSGGIPFWEAIDSGEFTVAADNFSSLTIPHGLPEPPTNYPKYDLFLFRKAINSLLNKKIPLNWQLETATQESRTLQYIR